MDPILCKGDKLLGNVMTAVGKGADIYVELEISCESLEWVRGQLLRPKAIFVPLDPLTVLGYIPQSSSSVVFSVSKPPTRNSPKFKNSQQGNNCLSTSVLLKLVEESWESREI